MKSNKDFSNKQESMIADYLGWKTVIASGARPFYKGDIISNDWIGECKTHKKSGFKITFKSDVWKKLKDEALSIHRYPVYFTDDGSQRSNRTWCLISTAANPFEIKSSVVDDTSITKTGNIIFDNDKYRDFKSVIESHIGELETVYVMKLCTFMDLLNGIYED